MGCCTSAPAPEPQQGPAPVKQPPQSVQPVGKEAAANSSPAAARTVTVNGAKSPESAAGAEKKNASGKQELKGMQRYEISPGVLGKGHFAIVKKARDIITGQIYAVKIIEKKELVKSSAAVVQQEIEILKAVGAHPNIVQLIDHFEDGTKRYLVMELCQGGDLFSQIVEHGKYSEIEAIRSCRQLAQALKHIHSCGITHRDLKPENILLTSPSPDSPLKLADFGLSKLIKGHLHPMRTVCGTWAYCLAPETLLRQILPGGKEASIQAGDVTRETVLVDEYYNPVNVKAIHTTEQSREQLWTVREKQQNGGGKIMFRCTGDHKLSLLELRASSSFLPRHHSHSHPLLPRRVEIRAEEFYSMSRKEQARYVGYTASRTPSSPSSSCSSPFLLPKHIGRTFALALTPPSPAAPRERYIGIEVQSETHRFMLDSEVVTSNCAPEVIQRKPYDSSVDNWTLGVLMYILLSGYHPFDVYGECPEPELLQKIIAASYDFDDPVWTNISEDAKQLIRGLLVLDPTKRLSLDTYLASSWINEGKQASQVNNTLVVERLSKFSVGKSKFRALAATLIASNKFKASISRSRTRNASKVNGGVVLSIDGIPLLSDGTPDYLGLGSERAGPSSARNKSQMDGLESVREVPGGLSGASSTGTAGTGGQSRATSSPTSTLQPVSGRTHEPSSSASGNSASGGNGGHTRAPLSVNHIDAVATTGRSDRASSLDATEDSSASLAVRSHEVDSPAPGNPKRLDIKGGLGRGSREDGRLSPDGDD